MKLIPLADRVVLKMMEAEETTKGGIILTGAAKEKPEVAKTPAGHAIPPKMGSMVGIYKGSTFTQSPTHPGQHRDHSSGFIPFKWPAWPKMSQTSLLKKLFYQGSEEIESSVHYL